MKRKAAIGMGAAAALVVVLVILWVFVIPAIRASTLAAAVAKRKLTIAHGSVAYRITSAVVDDSTLGVVGSKAITIKVPTIQAKVSGMRPSWVVIPSADVSVTGSLEDALAALQEVRRADEALPADERVPLDVTAGKFAWKSPFGAGTSIAFSQIAAWVRPTDGVATVKASGGKIDVGTLVIGGVSFEATRKTIPKETIDLVAKLSGDGSARLDAHRSPSGDVADLEIDDLGVGELTPKVPGLDLSKANVAGEAHAERSSDSEMKSSGKITITKVKLPPVKVGPVSISIGGTVKVTWKASPKKNAPGVMKLDDAKVDVTLGGKTRTIKVTGEIDVGEKAEGPYVVKLDWDLGPIACSEIAGDLGDAMTGGLGGSLLAGAVSGNVSVHGTIKGDLGEGPKRSMEIREACKVEVSLGKGLGGLIPGLP
ncbi:MAG: hypothetical protein ACXWUG_03200 [Polyangiales bacterium]